MFKSEVANLRQFYNESALNDNDVLKNPIDQFALWFDNALKADIIEPNAMVLSTIDKNKPKARVVLLKSFDVNGFVFFTNYHSHKGLEIAENNFGSLTFFWDKLQRQVRVEGKLEKVSEEISNEYFWSRPKESQIGAWVSQQSKVIESRKELDDNLAFYTEKFKNVDKIPKPDYWGGYILKPENIEFWQGRPSRLHDRILFEYIDQNWKISRLSP